MAPTLFSAPFHRDGWVYEEKVDGWQMLAYKDGDRVRLVSRNGVDHTRRFTDLAALLAVLTLAGCGTAFAIMVHPQTGHMVECRENLFDGITDTIGRCVAAYEQAGYVVRGRR